MDTTGKSLVEHWDWAASKGVMNKNSAGALRAACTQVLGVLDDWQNVDVTTIDADDVVQRFKNLRAKDFKPESLATYGNRFKKALSSYLEYTRDPGAWKATRQRRTRAARANGDGAAASLPESEATPPRTAESPRAGLVDYPFPLRDGLTARLMLPRDLKTSEVKRLSAFMSTLTVDFESADSHCAEPRREQSTSRGGHVHAETGRGSADLREPSAARTKLFPSSHIGPGNLRHSLNTSSRALANISTSFSLMINGGRILITSML